LSLYRFQILDSTGNPVAEEQQDCLDDYAALERARCLRDGHTIDVWQGDRWVTKVKRAEGPQ
jgi:hypothetical protein